MKTIYYVDKNSDYMIGIEYTPINGATILFKCNNGAKRDFYINIFSKLKIVFNTHECHFSLDELQSLDDGYFINYPNLQLNFPINISIYLDNKLAFTAYAHNQDAPIIDAVSNQLSVSAIRLLSTGSYKHDNLRFESKKHTFQTDLHTHFDGILSSEKLLEIALKHQALIDVTELIKLGIVNDNHLHKLTGERISISALKENHPLAYKLFSENLHIPSGKICIFHDLDNIYSHRDLITGTFNSP